MNDDINLPELRVGFEAWARDKMRGLLKPDSLMQLESDERTAFYQDAATAWAWAAWRAASTTPPASEPVVRVGEHNGGPYDMGQQEPMQDAVSVEGLMEMVSEFGQCRWSEALSGAPYLDRVGERRSREEAAELYISIRAYAQRLKEGK